MKSHTLLSSMHSASPQANQESGHGEGGGEVISVREFLISFSSHRKQSFSSIYLYLCLSRVALRT